VEGRVQHGRGVVQARAGDSGEGAWPEHPDVAVLLYNLANVRTEQERYDEAEALYKRALAIREKALGPEHPDVAMLLSDWATSYEAQGRSEDAELLYVRALSIREKALGTDHKDARRAREAEKTSVELAPLR
jgi:tetratricopeptide (TPR) repeat protein